MTVGSAPRDKQIMTVTQNWRMTFTIDEDDAIIDVDLEDYH